MCGSDAAGGEAPGLEGRGVCSLPSSVAGTCPVSGNIVSKSPASNGDTGREAAAAPHPLPEAVEEDGIVSLYLLSALVIRSVCVDAAKE